MGSKGWKRPYAERLKKRWKKIIIDAFKREYTDPMRHKQHPHKEDGDHSPLLCSEFEVRTVGNEDAESYIRAYTDWAKNIFMRRLGPCRGSWRRLDKRYRFFRIIARLPRKTNASCPAKCHHSDFHSYFYDHISDGLEFDILNEVYQPRKNALGFDCEAYISPNACHRNVQQFKIDIIQLMTLMQKYERNWSELAHFPYDKPYECGRIPYDGKDKEFDCMTICKANTVDAVRRFLLDRVNESKCEGIKKKLRYMHSRIYGIWGPSFMKN